MRKYSLDLGLIAVTNEHESYRMKGNRSYKRLCACLFVYVCVYMYMALYIVRKSLGTNMATMRT